MNELLILASAADFDDALIVSAVGITVVFAALALMWMMLSILKRIGDIESKINPADSPSPKAAPVPAVAPAVPPTTNFKPTNDADGLTPELVAVITAAAIVAVGRPLSIRKITLVSAPSSTWSELGRATIHSSHRLRKGNR